MTLTTDSPTADLQPGRRRARGPAAVWSAPVWAHLAALALVLLALSAVVGSSSSFSADEGAAILQARSLAAGHGWIVADPVAAADPTGVNYPLELSEHGPRGSAPFGKHALYALVLAGADRMGGVEAMVLLSLAGTVAAAGLAAALARRLDPALARPTAWAVGLASPLLFDGFVVIAHTVGAALVGAGVLAAVVAFERRSPLRAVAVVPPLVACVLLRNEGLFIAAGLAAAAAYVGLRRRELRAVAGVVAAGALVAGAGAHLVDRWWTAHLLGGSSAATPAAAGATAASPGLVAGRIQGFLVTWLTPSYGGHPVTSLALLVMLAAVGFTAATVRWHPENAGRVRRSAVAAAGAATVALVAGPGTVVPGLLLAFPLVVAGLLLVGRSTFRTVTATVLGATSVVFGLAVLATQYAKGGGGEWGGRYFALAIPLYVPVLLLALRDQRARLSAATARAAVVALVVCSAAMATMGVSALWSSHRATAALVAAVDRTGRTVAPADPVMVTTEGSMPRFAWSTFDRQRWLLSTPSGVDDLIGRLRAAGVTRVGFVSRDIARDQPELDRAGARVVGTDGSQSARRWVILVLQIA